VPEAIDFRYLIKIRKSARTSAARLSIDEASVATLNMHILCIEKPNVLIEMMGLWFIPVMHKKTRYVVAWCPRAKYIAFFVPRWLQDLFENFASKKRHATVKEQG
jgi:hypothetical protein